MLPEISGPPVHLGKPGCRRRRRPRPRCRFKPAATDHQFARPKFGSRCARNIRAMRSPSPASPSSRRITVPDMIEKLNRGLTIEIIFVAAFIGAAFRSIAVMLAAIMPAIFPVFVAGAVLWLLGQGLQFASVVALTVSFGLGLSATIHFLNRLRLEDKPGQDPAIGVERATILVGPALILTSVVLACGLAMTVFSRSAVAAALRLAQFLRHADRAHRRSLHPAADDHVSAALAQRHTMELRSIYVLTRLQRLLPCEERPSRRRHRCRRSARSPRLAFPSRVTIEMPGGKADAGDQLFDHRPVDAGRSRFR